MKNYLWGFLLLVTTISVNAQQSGEYEDGTLIIKVKDDYRSQCSDGQISDTKLEAILIQLGMDELGKIYPKHDKPKRPVGIHGLPTTDLSLIYKLHFTSGTNVYDAAQALLKTGLFEYVEPSFIMRPMYSVNDPSAASQWHLATIKAYEAWDTQKGDTNVVIGITDTGFDIDHVDLMDNVKYNYDDPIDGIDNDGDGYIDNYRGWDTGDNDNDPSSDVDHHGVMVSGAAGASTDNDTLVAGTGFKCKILPVKISSGTSLSGAYTGLIYCADQGCQIINASWGGANSWSQYGQDVINYCTINKNALVICSAGNDNDEDLFYPASFEWAISVGATESTDRKWSYNGTFGSNYNEWVDIVAPGANITTTNNGGGTISGRVGTSFASPILAGAAGIVKAQYPSYSSIQIGELLKATADTVDTMAVNIAYLGKLGEGRLNMERSVTETGTPGFYMTPVNFNDYEDGLFAVGDTVSVYGNLYNFLSASVAAKMEISTTSPYIQWIDSVVTIGAMAGNGTGVSTSSAPFRFVVLAGTPASETVTFKIKYSDGSYDSKQMTSTTLNVDYINISINDIGFTVGASGKTGYNTVGAQTQGVGFTYNGSNSGLYQMGLILAENSTKLSFVLDNEWETKSDLTYDYPGTEADLDVFTEFDDDPAGGNKLNISIKQKTLAWDDSDKRDFIIVEYELFNNSGADYSNLHLGLYTDFDIVNYAANSASFDSTSRTGYSTDGTTYMGVHILSDSAFHHYAFNNDGSSGSYNLYDGFSDAEKFASLTGGDGRNLASNTDVSQMVGVGPINLANGDSVIIAFAIVAGASESEIQTAALTSDTVYESIRVINISEVYNNQSLCFGESNGALGVQAEGGIAPYTYLWNDAGNQTADTALGLPAGSYEVTVEDAIGNMSTLNIVLGEPDSLYIDFTDTVMDHESGCVGEIQAAIVGGTPGYTLNWLDDGLRDSLHAVNLCQAIYTLQVIDANGCMAEDSVAISNIVSVEGVQNNGMSLYPNPASNQLNLTFEKPFEAGELKIIDANGRIIFTLIGQGQSLVEIDLNGLSAGVYTVLGQSENSSFQSSFVLSK